MLSYLEKYNNIPKDLKDKVSSPEIMSSILAIEKEYELSLAVVIMRVMVKEISMADLAKFFVFENGMDGSRANKLVEDLKVRVFYDVFRYLDIGDSKVDKVATPEEAAAAMEKNAYFKKRQAAPPVQSSNFFFSTDDEEEIKTLTKKLADFGPVGKAPKKVDVDNNPKIDTIIKEANLSFSSEEMNTRFRKMLDIYLKRVRNKVDTKQTMTKLISSGGLGVSDGIADKILSVTDSVEDRFIKAAAEASLVDKAHDKKEKNELEDIFKEEKGINSFNLDDDKVDDSDDPKKADDEKTKEKEGKFDIMDELGKTGGGDVAYNFNRFKKTEKKELEKKTDDVLLVDESQGKLDINKVEQDLAAIDLDKLEVSGQFDFAKKQEALKDANEREGKKVADNVLSRDKLVIKAEQGAEKEEKKDKLEAGEEELVLDLSSKKNDGKEEMKSAEDPPIETKIDVSSISGVKVNRPAPGVISTPAPDGKIKMEDVKYVPKLMGPIDELGEMNLINFRRLSENPVEAAGKIEEKIKFLEEDRYAKRIEGIKAWRKSPINMLYLEIGQEGIIVARGIENAIKAREKSKKDFLSLEEFNAIMELNKRIRY